MCTLIKNVVPSRYTTFRSKILLFPNTYTLLLIYLEESLKVQPFSKWKKQKCSDKAVTSYKSIQYYSSCIFGHSVSLPLSERNRVIERKEKHLVLKNLTKYVGILCITERENVSTFFVEATAIVVIKQTKKYQFLRETKALSTINVQP